MNREQQLAEAFAGLADSFADDFDPVVLLDRLAGHCVDIIGADGVGIMMAGVRGTLRTMAVSDDSAALLELFQSQTGEGPCLDCYRTHRPVDAPDLARSTDRWPRLAPVAMAAGYRSAHAFPLRVSGQTIGAVNLFSTSAGGLRPADLKLAQALADVAAVALVHWSPDPVRAIDIQAHGQAALAAKASVEMAQGMLAEHGGRDLVEALRVLRAYAARNGGRLTETAQALIRRTLAPDAVLTEGTNELRPEGTNRP
ncbi:GAF and ANTAR domain-containing protein [Streptomyces sp. HC44]|uniref:GAF and ANTAR domain-containing protein n=1 Tax=Streptomyces scabichelini TaxID=2711217 RepID=A0A6G4VNT0_9ACTN|nr:GAF and ANTAR domain-containing protein [Streptomyces scabichelini]NGO15450.1 GAF and ANTAR domain-containing protein [Streptomyces scabichelini]